MGTSQPSHGYAIEGGVSRQLPTRHVGVVSRTNLLVADVDQAFHNRDTSDSACDARCQRSIGKSSVHQVESRLPKEIDYCPHKIEPR